jgi:serine/threonine protein kinase
MRGSSIYSWNAAAAAISLDYQASTEPCSTRGYDLDLFYADPAGPTPLLPSKRAWLVGQHRFRGWSYKCGRQERRAQILHRDIKPDNSVCSPLPRLPVVDCIFSVFLDEANRVKLGDFGLFKALAQASFANTNGRHAFSPPLPPPIMLIQTPYYMSPELLQEKAYDSKSDIWSLGCLIYELCAFKSPFHQAKTHAELSVFVR